MEHVSTTLGPIVSAAPVKSRSAAPIRKVGVGGLGGAVAAVAILIYEQAYHQKLDPTLASAITVIITFLVGYYVPPGANDAPDSN